MGQISQILLFCVKPGENVQQIIFHRQDFGLSIEGIWIKFQIIFYWVQLMIGQEKWAGGKNVFTNETVSFSELARDYKRRGQFWLIVAGDNYGEGSSREHAAMTPRYLGAKSCVSEKFLPASMRLILRNREFLPLTFVNPDDENRFLPEDRVSIIELGKLEQNSQHPVVIQHKDDSKEQIVVKHSLNSEQIKWFKAGSSLNTLR